MDADKEREMIRLAKLGCYSRGEIAEKIGVSRNAVIGKLNRMRKAGKIELIGATSPENGGTQLRRRFKLSTKGPKLPPTKAKESLALEPLGPENDFPPHGTCQFIKGDVKTTWRCCGRKALPGKPWCADHLAVVYDKTATKRVSTLMKLKA